MNRQEVISYLNKKTLNNLNIGDEDIIFIRNLINYKHNKLIPIEQIIYSFQRYPIPEILNFMRNMVEFCLDEFKINTITGKNFTKFY